MFIGSQQIEVFLKQLEIPKTTYSYLARLDEKEHVVDQLGAYLKGIGKQTYD